MRLRILSTFGDKLNDQVEYIANDKPAAARKFKRDFIMKVIKGLDGVLFNHIENSSKFILLAPFVSYYLMPGYSERRSGFSREFIAIWRIDRG